MIRLLRLVVHRPEVTPLITIVSHWLCLDDPLMWGECVYVCLCVVYVCCVECMSVVWVVRMAVCDEWDECIDT